MNAELKPQLNTSYSQVNTFLNCRQLWWWQYQEKLTPRGKVWPLQLGDIIHRLRQKYLLGELTGDDIHHLPDKVQELFPDNEQDLSDDLAYQAAKVFGAWLKKGFDKDIEIVSPEVILEKTFTEPLTGVPYLLYARLDAMCRTQDGRLWRDELKTSARTDMTYLKGLKSPLQTGIAYMLCDPLFEEEVKGTIFHMCLTTKIPDAKREFAVRRKWVDEYAKRAVEGVIRDILLVREDPERHLYPSLRCTPYSRECDFAVLCQGATPRQKEELFQNREEVKEKSQNASF
jgi:hypothetical protein